MEIWDTGTNGMRIIQASSAGQGVHYLEVLEDAAEAGGGGGGGQGEEQGQGERQGGAARPSGHPATGTLVILVCS